MKHPTTEQLERWLFAKELVPKNEEMFIRTHCKRCTLCSEQVKLLQRMYTGINEQLNGTPSEGDRLEAEKILGKKNKIKFTYILYRTAAVVAFFALLGIMYYYLNSTKYALTQNPIISELRNDSVTPPQQKKKRSLKKEVLYADNFTPSPNLEDLVQTEFRSADVEVILPVNGAVVKQPIKFYWKGNSEGVTLKILTNKEKNIFTVAVVDSVFDLKKKLASGMYYWKLESKNELVYIGKFFVQ